MTKDELFQRICLVTGFLSGWGPEVDIAARKLRELMDEVDVRGLQAAEPIAD